MNNEKFIEEFNKKNEMFVRDLTSKESFVLSWHAGAVLPISHPKYYNGRINVEIRKIYNNSFGNINFEKDEYQVSNEIVNKLYSYVENNIEKLVKLALNQTTEMYEGVSDNLSIKFKSIYISLSRLNAASEEEKNEIYKIKEEIKKLICVNKKTTDNIEVNDANNITFEKAKKIADEKAKEWNKVVVSISENNEYWLFNADNDSHPIDDGAGSCYISKKDGSVRPLNRWDIEFTKKFDEAAKDLLVRTSLSELYGYHSKNNINDEKSALEYIDNISKAFLKYTFKPDNNFIFLGRKKFIYDEINDILKGNKEVDNPIYFVLGSLEEFICNNNFVYMSDGDQWEKGWEDLRNRNDIYSAMNVICLEEKNIIDNIISEIKNYIKTRTTL